MPRGKVGPIVSFCTLGKRDPRTASMGMVGVHTMAMRMMPVVTMTIDYWRVCARNSM